MYLSCRQSPAAPRGQREVLTTTKETSRFSALPIRSNQGYSHIIFEPCQLKGSESDSNKFGTSNSRHLPGVVPYVPRSVTLRNRGFQMDGATCVTLGPCSFNPGGLHGKTQN